MVMQNRPPQAAARRAFSLDLGQARALWLTPEGEWVAVARGQRDPFVLYNLLEWDDVAEEGEVELTADADGRVARGGRPLAPGDPAWVVSLAIRGAALGGPGPPRRAARSSLEEVGAAGKGRA
jgi:hypothetical protein